MDMTYRWYPRRSRNPHIIELLSHENNTIVFDGYFYVEEKDLPVQRIMCRYSEPVKDDEGNTYRTELSSAHIEIVEKISGKSTSYPESEEEELKQENSDDIEDNICLFPTEITTLKYRVLKSDLTPIERNLIEEVIKEEERKKLDELMKSISE